MYLLTISSKICEGNILIIVKDSFHVYSDQFIWITIEAMPVLLLTYFLKEYA